MKRAFAIFSIVIVISPAAFAQAKRTNQTRRPGAGVEQALKDLERQLVGGFQESGRGDAQSLARRKLRLH